MFCYYGDGCSYHLHSQRATVYEKMGRKDLAEKERKATKNSVLDEWGDFLKN